MIRDRSYFLCGIGGSGMLPLALLLRARGFSVAGSDRALDQGRTAEKFDYLRAHGIRLFPQDGSGITSADTTLVTSAAVEATVPDVEAARRIGAPRLTRALLLAELFNAAPDRIAVGGTSGKSTTTGMIGWILHQAGRDPTIINGAVMKNFVTADAPFASAVVGNSGVFVSEVDESDGSIAHYAPRISVLNNIALDHKSLEELRALFHDFAAKAELTVLNLDNAETAAIAHRLPGRAVMTYSLNNPQADLIASDLVAFVDGIAFEVTQRTTSERARARLAVPGRHNVSNALAAVCAARALDVPLEQSLAALGKFAGLRRRLEHVGEANGITVLDDFAHNPDKILATLSTLHDFPGRLLILFQPHGFGPLKLMKDALIECFADNLNETDVLLMPDPVYFGGTADRSVSSRDIVRGVRERGREAQAFADRVACGDKLLSIARPGDRIVVMGARDDTLSEFARELLDELGG
jgi:UDP-N-acetylmuramate--alanine ligase